MPAVVAPKNAPNRHPQDAQARHPLTSEQLAAMVRKVLDA
jgi:hypothetical protein